MKVIIGIALIAVAMALSTDRKGKRQQTPAEQMNLPANATLIRVNIVNTFSCQNRTYRYYADVANECQIYHVCVPVNLPAREARTLKYSFICPKGTVFNQKSLTCTFPIDAIPCNEAPSLYSVAATATATTTNATATTTTTTSTNRKPDVATTGAATTEAPTTPASTELLTTAVTSKATSPTTTTVTTTDAAPTTATTTMAPGTTTPEA